jgi:hypothetical protein
MHNSITVENVRHESVEVDEGSAPLVDIGDAAVLTEGQGGGNSEDKRRAYNC